MARMPYAPERSKLEQAPLEVRDYIQQLEKLARDGVKFRDQVSAEFKIGKVFKDEDGELNIQVKAITKRGNKPAGGVPLKQLYVNGEPMIQDDGTEVTNANGVWSKLYHTELVDFLEFELELEQNGKVKKFSDTLLVQMPKEKLADKLLVVSPEIIDDHTIGKTHDSFGSYLVLQTLCGQEPIRAEVQMVSDIYFQYSIGEEISVASKNHTVEVDGGLTLTILPSRDRQKITFLTKDGVGKTIEFRK